MDNGGLGLLRAIIGNDSKRDILTWNIAAVVFWAGLVLAYFFLPDIYIWLATEDAFGENLTAVFYGVAGILLFILPFQRKSTGRPLKTYILSTLLALLFIFVAGEEISWGQRILGIETPEKLAEQNVQGEFNFHNLEFFDRHSGLLNQHTILNVFCLLFGVVIPLLNRFSAPIRNLLTKMYFPVVPLSFVGFFVVGIAHGQTIAKFQTHWAHTEVKELIFSVGILLFGISYYFNQKKPNSLK